MSTVFFSLYDYICQVGYDGSETLDSVLLMFPEREQGDVSSCVTLGPGAIAYTVQVLNQETGQPLGDVDVWVTTNPAGTNVIASGKSDQSGNVVFYLDSGCTIYIWKQRSGYNFSNPEQKVVS